MKTGAILTVGAGALIVTGIAYRNGVNRLHFDVEGFQFTSDGGIIIMIRVTNPNRFFGYPVPRMMVNAYDINGNFAGTIINQQLQYIPANGISFIYGYVAPHWTNLLSIVTNIIITGNLPAGLQFTGSIQVGPVNIPFTTLTPLPAI